jgi:predicted nucleotidyltransferase
MNDLNSNFWIVNGEEIKINPRVRKNLLKIARDFVKFIDIKNLKISDIILTGSMAGYNWHPKSDVDLHIVFDLSNFDKHASFIEKFLQSKKTNWNEKHNITMYHHPIEIYPQNSSEPHVSSGQFSLIKNKWISVPVRKEFDMNRSYIMDKYQSKVDELLNIISQYENKKKPPMEVIEDLKKFLERLRDARKEGLRVNGEFSIENLVYKLLRSNGYLQKIVDLENEIYDKEMKIESSMKLKNIYNNRG